MSKAHQKIIAFIAWMFLIHVTHAIIYGGAAFLFPMPVWMSDLTFFIIAGIYVYILIRYRVRIDITIEDKQVFYFRNRGKH